MFGKKELNLDKIDTLIGKNTKLEGKINAQGVIRFDGELIGNLSIEGSVIIGEDGKIKGNVVCDNIIISGIVEGNIICKEQLRITNTGKLYGDVDVKSFIVDENAIFEGACKMKSVSQNSTSKEKSTSKGA